MRDKEELTKQIISLREKITIHSYIYYILYETVVSDFEWQLWANELRDLQAEHGTKWGKWDAEFEDWDGSTGMHLPTTDDVKEQALKLLQDLESY